MLFITTRVNQTDMLLIYDSKIIVNAHANIYASVHHENYPFRGKTLNALLPYSH